MSAQPGIIDLGFRRRLVFAAALLSALRYHGERRNHREKRNHHVRQHPEHDRLSP